MIKRKSKLKFSCDSCHKKADIYDIIDNKPPSTTIVFSFIILCKKHAQEYYNDFEVNKFNNFNWYYTEKESFKVPCDICHNSAKKSIYVSAISNNMLRAYNAICDDPKCLEYLKLLLC